MKRFQTPLSIFTCAATRRQANRASQAAVTGYGPQLHTSATYPQFALEGAGSQPQVPMVAGGLVYHARLCCGGSMQVESMAFVLKASATKRLKLNCNEPLSTFD